MSYMTKDSQSHENILCQGVGKCAPPVTEKHWKLHAKEYGFIIQLLWMEWKSNPLQHKSPFQNSWHHIIKH